ncbi:MAG: hypothetical protein KGR26_09470, partial [Cyanobacteria bacterium REEB65]|nr:hypothetical protein [Cyanobacteria bacterium REEB65]
VVKVHCTACNQPAGVAIVGVEYESVEVGQRERSELPAPGPGYNTRSRAIFSSRREEERFAGLEPISGDDVLNAHQFFKDLGANWMDQIPKRK